MKKGRVRSLANIRTAGQGKIHAKPKAHDADHLDLFLLMKNRERLEQERRNVEERLERMKKDIQGVDEEIAKINNSAHDPVTTTVGMKEKLPRSTRKMSLQY